MTDAAVNRQALIYNVRRKNAMKIFNFCQHSFIGDFLSSDSCIMDFGVHRGEFSESVSRQWGCKIFGLEPDPGLFDLLPSISNCSFFQIALANREDHMRLYRCKSRCSSISYREGTEESLIVETTSMPAFCTQNGIGVMDLVKLDIEGAELDVLEGLEDRFVSENIVQLTVEFHDFMGRDAKLRIDGIIRKLRRIGFYYLPFSRTSDDILFVNHRFIKLSWKDRLQIFCIKYKRGIGRIIRRCLIERDHGNNF
jgi:FkbM family methyltransferase